MVAEVRGSLRVDSARLGRWHHPRFAKGRDGRSVFVATDVYDYLLLDLKFRVWYDHYGGRTSRHYAKLTVHRVLQVAGLSSPTDFLELSVQDAKIWVRAAANRLIREKHEAAARQMMVFAACFYNWFNEDAGRVMRFRRSDKPRVVRKKVVFQIVPYNNDVWKMADACLGVAYYDSFRNKVFGLRNRAAILFDWASGLRVNGLCSLKYKHIQDYVEGRVDFEYFKRHFKTVNIEHWEQEELKLSQLPPLFLKVTPEIDSKLSGYGLAYYVTFVNKKAFNALKEWLEFRETENGALQREDYVFTAFDFKKYKIGNRMWNPQLVLNMLKTVARRAGIDPQKIWFHCLRDSFRDKVLRPCVAMDEQTKEALMGHKQKGSQQNYFDHHDILWIAQLYMKADWSRGQASRLKELSGQVGHQQSTIEELQTKLEEYRLKLASLNPDRIRKLEREHAFFNHPAVREFLVELMRQKGYDVSSLGEERE